MIWLIEIASVSEIIISSSLVDSFSVSRFSQNKSLFWISSSVNKKRYFKNAVNSDRIFQ